MQKTENYQLNLWEMSDQVVPDGFNENTEKIDTALAGLKSGVEAALATLASGVPKIKVGTYTGNDKFGSSNPVKLTFDFKPKFLMVWGCDTYIMLGIEGQTVKIIYGNGYINQISTWGSNYVSWYYHSDGGFAQMNHKDTIYSYIAIG